MADKREYVNDSEEAFRTAVAGAMRGYWKVMPCLLSADTEDGHSCVPQPSVQRAITDPITGLLTYLDHPVAPDVPIHFAGGGGVTATHPVKKGDEGIVLFADRNIDVVRQQGGTAQPFDDRQHHLGDGLLIPGIRSDPRKLMQVSNDAHHIRSDDKLHVSEVHPQNGITHTSADPSTPPASANFDPLTMATKFIRHAIQGASGLLGQAVSGGTVHDHGIDYVAGPFMRAANAIHSVLCHAQNGPSMNAANLLHSVLAHPSLGAMLSGNKGANTVTAGMSGVTLQSPTSISLSCPAGGLGLPSGSIGGSSLGSGAAAQNVGPVGGDLSGTLPNPQVVGLGHVDAHLLPAAASDAAAATAGVTVGGLYRNTAVMTGVSVLAVRMS